MKVKKILDGSPYRLNWFVWLRGTPGVVILIAALAVVAALIGWHFFNQYTETEMPNVIAKPVTQSTAPAITAQSTIKSAAQQTSYKETVVPERPKPIHKTGKHSAKHYAEKAATKATTQDEQEVAVKSGSSANAVGETPVAEPAVDYWSSVSKYTKAVENQSKEIDGILSSANTIGETPVAKPAVDYWSSVNKYTKAVENQSKEIDGILKRMNGGN